MIVGARSDTSTDAADVCRRHQLSLRDVWPTRHGNSVFVARVTDATNRTLALKRTLPGRSRSEVAALSAWQETGAAVRLHADLEVDVFLMEWLDGPCLADCSVALLDVPALGRMLRALHTVSPPAEVPELRHRFAAAPASGEALPEAMRRRFIQFSDALYGADPEGQTLLPGDLSPINVILTAAGPKVIDPVGYRGPPAWDIAQLAAAAEGRGLAGLLPGLLAGYGSEPPFLAKLFAWHILAYLNRNLAAGQTTFSGRLLPFAEALLEADDPTTFLHGYRAQYPLALLNVSTQAHPCTT